MKILFLLLVTFYCFNFSFAAENEGNNHNEKIQEIAGAESSLSIESIKCWNKCEANPKCQAYVIENGECLLSESSSPNELLPRLRPKRKGGRGGGGRGSSSGRSSGSWGRSSSSHSSSSHSHSSYHYYGGGGYGGGSGGYSSSRQIQWWEWMLLFLIIIGIFVWLLWQCSEEIEAETDNRNEFRPPRRYPSAPYAAASSSSAGNATSNIPLFNNSSTDAPPPPYMSHFDTNLIPPPRRPSSKMLDPESYFKAPPPLATKTVYF